MIEVCPSMEKDYFTIQDVKTKLVPPEGGWGYAVMAGVSLIFVSINFLLSLMQDSEIIELILLALYNQVQALSLYVCIYVHSANFCVHRNSVHATCEKELN